jgi:hypothetical protein
MEYFVQQDAKSRCIQTAQGTNTSQEAACVQNNKDIPSITVVNG